jgi:hypothetical protein
MGVDVVGFGDAEVGVEGQGLRPPEMCRAVESKQSMIVKVGARW